MRILLTNDDGIYGRGLAVLEAIARKLSSEVWVVAPAFDQSGVSHSLSLNDPLRLRRIDSRRYALKGTPTDCVIFAIRHLMIDHPPDLLLSGVNAGQNLAEDVTYSGTIAGAMEGTLLGVRSFALSQAYASGHRENIRWDCARHWGESLIRQLLTSELSTSTLVNINFPDCSAEEVQGVAITRQGRRDNQILNIEERQDGRGMPYYWIAFAREAHELAEESDLAAIARRQISITPLHLNMTDTDAFASLSKGFR